MGRSGVREWGGAHFAPQLSPGTNLQPASYAGGACCRLPSPMRPRSVISSALGQSFLSAPIKGAATQNCCCCFRNTWKCVITGSWSPRVCVCVCMLLCVYVCNLHVHDVRFMQRLMFDLWVDDGRVRDPCGVRAGWAGHHVVREPAGTARRLVKGTELTNRHAHRLLPSLVSLHQKSRGLNNNSV